MKSNQISSIVLIACLGVFLASAAPTDTPSDSQSSPQSPTETAAQVQPTPDGFFVGVPNDVLRYFGNHLTVTESARLARASNHYRKALKGADQSPDTYFGSKEEYVRDVKHCTWLNENPDKKQIIKTIYVTSEVFMECKFNPTDYPQLRNVNIYLKNERHNHGRSGAYFNLFNDPGLIAFKEKTWTPDDPFILNTSENLIGYETLEQFALKFRMDWVKFLLKHRDWNSFKDPFKQWDNLLYHAITYFNADVIPLLFEIENKYSIRHGRDPFALERSIMRDGSKDHWFRGHVNGEFMNALIAVRSGNVNGVKTWLNDTATPEQISRVLDTVLVNWDSIGEHASEFESILLNDPRLDVKHRDVRGAPLIFNVIHSRHWEAFDILIEKEGIELEGTQKEGDGILFLAFYMDISFERFKRILEKGVSTFKLEDVEKTPLMIALQYRKYDFAKAILEKRKVENADGLDEIQLTAEEVRELNGSPEFKKLIGNHPIRIVNPA